KEKDVDFTIPDQACVGVFDVCPNQTFKICPVQPNLFRACFAPGQCAVRTNHVHSRVLVAFASESVLIEPCLDICRGRANWQVSANHSLHFSCGPTGFALVPNATGDGGSEQKKKHNPISPSVKRRHLSLLA